MQCRKCGAVLLDTDKFCTSCGEPMQDMNQQYYNPNNQPYQNFNGMNNQPFPNYNGMNNQPYPNYNVMNNPPYQMNNNNPNFYQQTPNQPPTHLKKKSALPLVLGIVGGIVGLAIIGLIVFFILPTKSNKMICKSNEGSITIMFNKKGLVGYSSADITYKLDEQKEYAEQVGIDAYLKEFSAWFSENTTGSCTINGKIVEPLENNTNDNKKKLEKTKVVGDDKYGYVTVPENWNRFHDPNAPTELQYSQSNIFIVTLNILDVQLTAKECATNFMLNMKNSDNVEGVTGATVEIGKDKKYTAYEVYMYYPQDNTYLITYWFEAEDNVVHYIALEGPQVHDDIKLSDLLFIPDSFSLKK